MDKSERIKYAVEQLIGNGNINIVDEVFSINYIAHAENKVHKGQEFVKQFSKLLQSSLSNIRVLKVEILVEENSTITWQRTLQGIHENMMSRIPASNKTITWNEMVVSSFEGDKLAEEWIVSELIGESILQQQKTNLSLH